MFENEKLPPPVNLKHRLIGAVVLVAAVVILVPLILSEREPPTELKAISDIPGKDVAKPDAVPAPAPSEYMLPDDSRDGGGRAASGTAAGPAPEQKPATITAEKAPPKAASNVAKPDKGWVVQVGIFSNAGNATRLAERLKQQGYDVLLDDIGQNNEKRTRLRVGPFADKDAAQRAQAKIQQQAGVAGAVVTYP